MSAIKRDEIKNKTYKVKILSRGADGDTLWFNLYNEELGEFIMDNCHYNNNPSFFPEAERCVNGNAKIKINGEELLFFAALVIDQRDSSHGTITLRG